MYTLRGRGAGVGGWAHWDPLKNFIEISVYFMPLYDLIKEMP